MFHSSGYGDSKLLHLPKYLLQPLLPLSHSLCGDEPTPRHTHADRPALFPQRSEARLQEELPELWWERVRLIDDSRLEGCHTTTIVGGVEVPSMI